MNFSGKWTIFNGHGIPLGAKLCRIKKVFYGHILRKNRTLAKRIPCLDEEVSSCGSLGDTHYYCSNFPEIDPYHHFGQSPIPMVLIQFLANFEIRPMKTRKILKMKYLFQILKSQKIRKSKSQSRNCRKLGSCGRILRGFETGLIRP